MSERKKPARWRKYSDVGWELQRAEPNGMKQVLMVVGPIGLNGPSDWEWCALRPEGMVASALFPTAEAALADARKWWAENGS